MKFDLTDLKRDAARLNLATTALTAELQAVEKDLGALNLGVEANIPLADGYLLGYGRVTVAGGARRWGLYIAERNPAPSLQQTRKWPIAEAPRAARILAPHGLPTLIEALREAVDYMLNRFDDVIPVARQMAQAIHVAKAEIDAAP